MIDQKYIVFKREEFVFEMQDLRKKFSVPQEAQMHHLQPVEDAVVIRRQDTFAPPALDAYANAILTAAEGMHEAIRLVGVDDETGEMMLGRLKKLREVSAYFHDQAELSWDTNRKLPD